MDQLLRITLDAIGRVTSNHEYRLKALEANQAKPESCASDCSADGRRIKQGEASVQPTSPKQTLAKHVKEQIQERIEFLDEHSPYDEPTTRHILQELDVYYWMLNWHIEGEAGVAQDERSRPAG